MPSFYTTRNVNGIEVELAAQHGGSPDDVNHCQPSRKHADIQSCHMYKVLVSRHHVIGQAVPGFLDPPSSQGKGRSTLMNERLC
jgi:hypothetical protein